MIFAWIVAIHVTAVVGLVVFPAPGSHLICAALALAFIGGLGTTVCYHRALAHRSLKLHPAVQAILILLAMLNGAAPPGSWIATHRLHHATADTRDDPSSPAWRGFWWSHVAWHWGAFNPKRAAYAKDSEALRIWERFTIPLFLLAYAGGFLWGPAGFFWLGAIRLTFFFHSVSTVNSICHTQPGVPRGEDSSRNVAWLAPLHLFLGETWHRNHHSSPSSARLGLYWLQPDLGYLLIAGLERMGLATEVRGPRPS
jgi:fatty-acid desaturase